MAEHFRKTYQSAGDLVRLLQQRGLRVSNVLKAENYIRNIGYYRLSAYLYPLLKIPKDLHQFKKNSGIAQSRVFFNLSIIKYFLDIVSPNNRMKQDLLDLFQKYPSVDKKAMGFPENWKDEEIWRS